MNSKYFIFSALLGLLIISCDSTMMMKVGLGTELSNQDYSLIDFDFVLANSGTADQLYFEFVVNKELDQATAVTFFDRSGNVIAITTAGEAVDLESDSDKVTGERSYAYSIGLDNFRSTSLVHEVKIGNQ